MIIALEGPDGAGKTSLFEMLRGHPKLQQTCFASRICFANFVSMGKDLWPYAAQIEARDVALFESLYDPDKIYFCDRFFAVTGPVYGSVFNRRPVDYRRWHAELVVFYLTVPFAELMQRRHAWGELNDPEPVRVRLERIITAYDQYLSTAPFPVYYLGGMIPTAVLADQAVAMVTHAISTAARPSA